MLSHQTDARKRRIVPAMEPRIQYVKTSDGVSIAYWTMGEGDALVEMPGSPFAVSQLEWQMREALPWRERLARGRKLVRYDCRGFGLSEREVDDFALDAMVRDLEAIVEHLGLNGSSSSPLFTPARLQSPTQQVIPRMFPISSSGMRMLGDGNFGSRLRLKPSSSCEKSCGSCTRRRPRTTSSVGRRARRLNGSPRLYGSQ